MYLEISFLVTFMLVSYTFSPNILLLLLFMFTDHLYTFLQVGEVLFFLRLIFMTVRNKKKQVKSVNVFGFKLLCVCKGI